MDPNPGPSCRLAGLSATQLQSVLLACSGICASDTNLTAAQFAVEQVAALTGAEQAVVFLRRPPNLLSPLAARQTPPPVISLDQLPLSLEAQVYKTATGELWSKFSASETAAPALAGFTSAILAPTVAQGQVWGLVAAYTTQVSFSEADLGSLEAIAQALAVVTAARSAINHFQGLWDGAPLGLATVDLDGRVAAVNAALARLLGLDPEELVGRAASDFLESPTTADWREQLAAFAAAGDASANVITARRADGGRLVLETWSVPLMLAGTPVGIQVAVRDLTAERDTARQLEWLADHDPLTRLGNRRLLERAFLAMRGQDPDGRMTLMYVDICNFSKTNQSFGHDVGDRLLTELGRRLSEVLPPDAISARVGSDDFAVLLPESADAPPFLQLLDAIRAIFERPLHVDRHAISLRPAIGIALFPRHAPDLHGLLRAGALAASQLTTEGPTFAFYSDSAQSHLDLATQISLKLPGALGRGHLQPFYQPIVDLRSWRVVAVEALCRWHDPELGLVYPSRFIPLAEETGLIRDIGRFMISSACQQATVWQTKYRRPLRVQVNVSAVQFEDPAFPETVSQIVADSGLTAGSLALELTESVLIRVRETSLEPILALSRLGIPLIIDDFGIGFSSLSYLHHFRVDELKLDRSFLEPGHDAGHSSDLLRAMVRFAKSLQMLITVEGVEHASQVAALRRLGFQRAQGYVFAPPVAAAACETWLAQNRLVLAESTRED